MLTVNNKHFLHLQNSAYRKIKYQNMYFNFISWMRVLQTEYKIKSQSHMKLSLGKIFPSCWKKTVSETIVKLKRSKNQAALEIENGKTTAIRTYDFEVGGKEMRFSNSEWSMRLMELSSKVEGFLSFLLYKKGNSLYVFRPPPNQITKNSC